MNKVKSWQFKTTLCLLLAGTGYFAEAAEAPQALTKAVTISRPAAAKPVIDGRFSPEEWAGATLIEDLHLTQPTEFAKPSQRTQIYLLYDTDALYVAARNWDTGGVIGAPVTFAGNSIPLAQVVRFEAAKDFVPTPVSGWINVDRM